MIFERQSGEFVGRKDRIIIFRYLDRRRETTGHNSQYRFLKSGIKSPGPLKFEAWKQSCMTTWLSPIYRFKYYCKLKKYTISYFFPKHKFYISILPLLKRHKIKDNVISLKQPLAQNVPLKSFKILTMMQNIWIFQSFSLPIITYLKQKLSHSFSGTGSIPVLRPNPKAWNICARFQASTAVYCRSSLF